MYSQRNLLQIISTPRSPLKLEPVKVFNMNIQNMTHQSIKYCERQQQFFKEYNQIKSNGQEQNTYFSSVNDQTDNQLETTYLQQDNVQQIYNSEVNKQKSSCSSTRAESCDGKNKVKLIEKKVNDFSFCYNKKGINTLPKNLMYIQIDNLQILELNNNKFIEIPLYISKLVSLKTLRLDNNFIRQIPQQLFDNIQLEIFQIQNNLIIQLPTNIKLQKKLIFLDVSVNRITNIEQGNIEELQNLRSLHINNNEFTYIPSNFQKLQGLQELSLDWFKYTQPPLNQIQSSQKIIQKFLNFLSQIQFAYKQDNQINSRMYTNKIDFFQFIEYFSIRQCDLNIRDCSKRNLMHIAGQQEDIGVLLSLLQNQVQLINQLDQDNHTPLSISLLNEKYFSSKALIVSGANIDLGGGEYGSCLNISTIKFQVYLLTDLIKKGANPNQSDGDGNSALHYLMMIYDRNIKYSEKIFYLLLKNGANPNQKNQEQWTPIHLTVKYNQVKGLQEIIKYNKNRQNSNYFKQFSINKHGGLERMSALHLTVVHQNSQMAQILIKNNANLFSVNSKNKTPYHISQKDYFTSKIIQLYQKKFIQQKIQKKYQLSNKEQFKGEHLVSQEFDTPNIQKLRSKTNMINCTVFNSQNNLNLINQFNNKQRKSLQQDNQQFIKILIEQTIRLFKQQEIQQKNISQTEYPQNSILMIKQYVELGFIIQMIKQEKNKIEKININQNFQIDQFQQQLSQKQINILYDCLEFTQNQIEFNHIKEYFIHLFGFYCYQNAIKYMFREIICQKKHLQYEIIQSLINIKHAIGEEKLQKNLFTCNFQKDIKENFHFGKIKQVMLAQSFQSHDPFSIIDQENIICETEELQKPNKIDDQFIVTPQLGYFNFD